MTKERLNAIYREYQEKRDSILKEYGEKDGFVINGKPWWNYYDEFINEDLARIKENKFTIEDARLLYRTLGFGPKLYERTFIENGLEKIKKTIQYLSNANISSEEKIRNVVEDENNEYYLKGVGINFVTLFISSIFPKDYGQWNAQIDSALKLLKLYPSKTRGEKISSLYQKVNEKLKEIQTELDIENLPIVDNLLYCLNKGYIGNIKQLMETTRSEVVLPEKEKPKQHSEMQYYLIKIGISKGYDVWVAQNDRNKIVNREKLGDLCLDELPPFTQPLTLLIARFVDIIWFRKNTTNAIRFFEIEHTTSIYSGLLRLNDIKIDFPIGRATIVVPGERVKQAENQISRRTFSYSEIADVTDCITYSDLRKWYEAAKIEEKYK